MLRIGEATLNTIVAVVKLVGLPSLLGGLGQVNIIDDGVGSDEGVTRMAYRVAVARFELLADEPASQHCQAFSSSIDTGDVASSHHYN